MKRDFFKGANDEQDLKSQRKPDSVKAAIDLEREFGEVCFQK